MRCEELMTRDVECCHPGESVQQAAARMRWRNVGFLPAIDDRDRLVGTLTDRDIAIRIVADGRPPHTRVGEVMSTGVIYCSPNDNIQTAEELMIRFHKSRIVCVDEYGRPVGVISLSDIAEAEWSWRTGHVLKNVSAREVHAH